MYFKMLLEETIQLFTNPKKFFSGLKIEGDLITPIVKALVYSAIAGVIYFINGVIGPMFANFANILGLFIQAVIYGVIGLFLGAFVLWVLAMIVNANPKYSSCVYVTVALYPLFIGFVLLGQVLSFSGALSWLVMLSAWIYGFYLIFCALIYSLKAEEKAGKTLVGILVLIIVFAIISPLIMGFFVKGYDTLRFQFAQRMQDITQRMWRQQPRMQGFMPNQRPMGFPVAPGQNVAAPGMPYPPMGGVQVSTITPQNAAVPPSATMATPQQNLEMVKRIIMSNPKMTAEQKRQAIKRLEENRKKMKK